MKSPLLQIKNIKKYYQSTQATIRAIDDLSLDIYEGETIGLVGESGCGKSSLARLIVGLESITEGQIRFFNSYIHAPRQKLPFDLRRQVQMVFQDPYSSLNPRMTIEDIIEEPLLVHRIGTSDERKTKIEEILISTGLSLSLKNHYPHELSGGMRQRVGLARALVLEPKILILDEPVSALDVSIRAQIINLLKHLQKEKGLTILFISHDLSIVRYLSNKVAVMYLGKIIEEAPCDRLFKHPCHPYTEALLSAIPLADPNLELQRKKIILKGEIPSPLQSSRGCSFSSRCPKAEQVCFDIKPKWHHLDCSHQVLCHLSS